MILNENYKYHEIFFFNIKRLFKLIILIRKFIMMIYYSVISQNHVLYISFKLFN